MATGILGLKVGPSNMEINVPKGLYFHGLGYFNVIALELEPLN